MTKKVYKISDGNGGHQWDWKKIRETVIAGVLLTVIVSSVSTLLNRVFNVQKIERQIEDININMTRYNQSYLRLYQMTDTQNEHINNMTEQLYKHLYPGVPCPKLRWPEEQK